MRQTAVLSLLVLAGAIVPAANAFAADPALLNLVMPDAKVLAGVNTASVRISPLGLFVIGKIGLLGQDPQKFIAATGFNPLQDVSEILVASAGDPANPGGLILASGKFPVDKLTAALAGKTNPEVQTYGVATLIVSTDAKEKTSHAVAFIGTSIAIAGDLESVKAAVDRTGHPAAIADGALSAKMAELSSTEDEWLVSSASVGALIPANAGTPANGPAAQVLPLLKSIQGFNGGVKFGNNVVVSGELLASDAKNASSLQAVIKLGLALASGYQGDNNLQLQEATQLLQALQVTTNGAAVDLSLSIPETQIEAMINAAAAPVRRVAENNQRSRPQRNGR
jgi:hypothetical protein